MSINQSRIAEILYMLNTDQSRTAIADALKDLDADALALILRHGLRYVVQLLASAASGDEDAIKELADLGVEVGEDAEADAITLERDQVRGTEYESRYADANNHGLRYMMKVIAAAARGDEDAVKELADLDAEAQG